MKFLAKIAVFAVLMLSLTSLDAGTAMASTPYLSAYSSGSGNVQVTITGADRYSRIDLSYKPQGTSLWTLITNVGSTDQNGYFSQNVNIGYQGTQMDIYVTVNGQQSSTVSIGGGSCPYYGCGGGAISFSPSTLSLNAGQSQNVTIYESMYAYPTGSSPYYNNYYISNNSNSTAVSASISGNTMYVNGNNSGTANITVCSYNSSSTCGTLYVTVTGGNSQITFSQSSVYLTSGQSSNVSIYGGSYGSYYVSSNSNSGVVSASISGSTLNLYGYGNGSSTITVCSSGFASNCGYLYVTVSGGSGGHISFSPSNPTVAVGQTTYVNMAVAMPLYGPGSSPANYGYYISNNSNSAVVTASISGQSYSNNQLSLYGKAQGTASITVCTTYYSACGTVNVTVTGGVVGSNVVNIYDNYYSPSNITVTRGSTITFRNLGSMSHTVTANGGSFSSGTIPPGGAYSVVVNTSGTYSYYCQFHPGMTGSITVSGVLGGNTYTNGTLVNDNGTIYITYKNMKSGFANYPAFTGLGYRLSNVISANTATLNNSGYVVSTANAPHPWGSWIKNGNTIYFVHEQGLVPISAYDIFVNNGGSLEKAVNANSYDMQKPMLSIMTHNDPRLQ